MTQPQTHPTDAVLGDFLLGKLSDPDVAEIEGHLADCTACQARAASTPASDTLVGLLAAGARSEWGAASARTPVASSETQGWAGAAPTLTGDAEVPAVLAGHPKYETIRQLGVGGMGTVWLAQHAVMNRLVAIKVIRPDLLARPGATGRFLREVRAAAKLHHPNIVTAFDAEPAGDSCLLVMEYVDGETLAERMSAGPLPVAEACRAVCDAARGLAHAHAAGLVHRDVKPHNLIRAADGTTKVLDFGLAGVGAGEMVAAGGDGLSGAGMVCGTPDYIAPEQAADPHTADGRADIYGLGCTLYHLLAGRPPFPEGSIMEKLTAQQKRHPDPIPGLLPDLAAVLAKMTAKRPEDRYQSAEELLAALEPFCAGSPFAERGTRKSARSAREQRSPPWVVAAGVLIMAFVVAAVLVFKVWHDQEIVITTDDPDVEVVMKRKGEVVLIRDAKSGQTWGLDLIKNQIGLADQPGGLTLALPDGAAVVMHRQGDKKRKPSFTVTRTAAPGKSDHERILGTWQAVAAEADGETVPREFIDAIQPTLTFTPEKLTARPGMVQVFSFLEAAVRRGFLPREAAPLLKKGIEGVYHLDPTRSPKTIDITILGDEIRRSALGLYTLEGDTLKLCLSLNPDKVSERPTEFSSKGSGFRGIVTLKRQVPEKGGMIHDLRWPGGKANIYYAAFSPDGRYVLASSDAWQPATAVWETATGNFVVTLAAPAGAVFLPDSKTVLASGPDEQLVLWDVATDREVRKFPRRSTLGFLSVSADGSRAVSYHGGENSDGTLVVWDVAAATPVTEFQPKHKGGYLARISPDGKRIVTAGQKDQFVRLWEVAEKTVIREWASKEGSVFGPIIFLPDGRSFLIAPDTRGRVARFDDKSDAPAWLWDDRTQAAMGVSSDGRVALVYNDNTTVRGIDLATGKGLGAVELPSKVHGYMGVSADGRYGVATATSLQTEAPARVYVFRLPDAPAPKP